MDYRIIPISKEHIEGFHTALDSVARERRYLAFLEAPPIEECTAFVQENIQKGRPQLVAIAAERVVGWCDVLPVPRPVKVHGGVLGVGVIAGFRARGIGTALIRATLEKAQAIGLTRVELTVRENNKTAIVLYEKLGFIREGLKRNAICIDGKYENLICMGLLFDEIV